MKTKAICLIGMIFLATAGLAAPDSLACRTIDWLDAPGNTMHYGSGGIDGDGGYDFSGTWVWDMAMGDSFLVWLPGTDRAIFVKSNNQTAIETTYCDFYSSENIKGCAVKDSMFYLCGGGLIWSLIYGTDSIALGDYELIDPWASFHYAVIQDTFLYTASTGSYGLHCINIANPESIFVAWTNGYYIGFSGMEVVDSVVYSSSASTFHVSPPDDWHSRPHWYLLMADVSGDTCVVHTRIEYSDNEHHCSIASNDENLFYAYTEMTDFLAGEQDFSLGNSHLGIWGTDFSYTWEDYDSEGVFGVEVLNDTILAVGFEHGFSIVNYTQLAGMTEVAYYRDTDSIYCFTHFARKGNRMYAMAHPREGICRMYMFELDSTIWTGISDPAGNKGLQPLAFAISAYPNPFNSAVTIAIEGVGDGSPVPFDVEIYDVNGRRIAQLPVGEGLCALPFSDASPFGSTHRCSPTEKAIVWTPHESLPSGVYLVRARAGDGTAARRVVYLK